VALSAHLDLLVLLLKDEAFNELRTKQQLGYIGKEGAGKGGREGWRAERRGVL